MGIPDNIIYIDTLGNGDGLRYNGYLEPILESLEKSKTDIYWLAANHKPVQKPLPPSAFAMPIHNAPVTQFVIVFPPPDHFFSPRLNSIN